MLFDTHVHTSISPCSNIRVDEIAERAKQLGLEGICITDHHSMAAGKHLTEGIQPNGLVVIFGMEYETKD